MFSKTAGFRHDAIPAGIAAVTALGEEHGFDVDTTEDAAAFTDQNLAQYDVVIWMSTTGDVLNADQQAAFERYVQNGGGYTGVHAASDTEYAWPWYGKLVGAFFQAHPQNQTATVKVEDPSHPSTEHLPDRWQRYDEWYNYQTNPRGAVHVLASLDEKTYTPGAGAMGADHPIAWCQNYDGGRSWYTGGGHTIESYSDPAFLQHLLGGIRTSAGVELGECSATQDESYELVLLEDEVSNPMMLDVADNGDVFYAERDGRVRLIDAATGTTTNALALSVFQQNEDGLQGLVLDPDFETNNRIYVYWSPLNVGTHGPHNALSRFTYNPATKVIDPASRIDVLRVPVQRESCCHVGGDMIFDGDGNLILVTGDNSNPFDSSGYSPMDERAGRSSWDARRTSGNTNDLRGKVLRITPQADGTYTIPSGNLFAPGTAKTLPEIYAMGFRNPFRIDIDPKTNHLMVADYGPDAQSANANRGPDGRVEWNLVSEPGNYGWPFCHSNTCYNKYSWGTSQSGAKYDPQNLVNDSSNNTGLSQLPPVTWPEVWYGYGTNPLFPEIGGGGAPMAGPVYRYDEELDSDVKWPEYWDGKAIFGEWNQGRLYSFQLDKATSTEIVDINRVLPGHFDPTAGFARAMDMTFGPDGSMYVIDWGEGFWGNNANAGIYKVNYTQGDASPIARASANVRDGQAPLTVQFSSEGTRHPASLPITLEWDFGDGSAPVSTANPVHIYTENGQYTARLTVSDGEKTAHTDVSIVVGNTTPIVTIDFPDNGGFFEWGDQVRYEVTVDDPDGEFDCGNVTVHPALGHDAHAHPMEIIEGCEGVIQTSRDDGHGADANIFWVVEARYTDDGGEANVPLTGYGVAVLQPKRLQAEHFTNTGRVDGIGTGTGTPGVQSQATTDPQGGNQNIGYIEPGDWWSHEPVSLYNVESLGLRVASSNASGGVVSVRWGSPTGQELGKITVPNTGGWQNWQNSPTLQLPADAPTGSGGLFFVLLSGGLNVNWLDITGRGVTNNVRPEVNLTVDATSGTAPVTVNASVTATDPDGDSALITYQWDQGTGAGFQPGGDTATFTYTEPGTWRLSVRATDENGAYADTYREIAVADVPAATDCLSGRSDDFLGAALDEERWEVLNRDQTLSVSDGALRFPASKSDFYGTTNGVVSNLVLQDLPAGPFEATAKVTFEARSQWQQAGLVIYGDNNNYAKIVMQGRNAGASAADRVFQFLREENGAPNEVAASNSVALGVSFPDTYFVRFNSDGTNLTASYSADGVTFAPMSQTKSLAGITNPRIGLMALAGSTSIPNPIVAQFDWFKITPDDSVTPPTPNDEFDGSAIDKCRWGVVNEQPAGHRVKNGWLEIDTTHTDIYGANNVPVPNLMLQPQPAGDWTVETKVDGAGFDRQYQQGGIILYGDDGNWVKVNQITTNAAGSAIVRNVEVRSEVGDVVQNPQPQAAASSSTTLLRLAKSGTTFTGSFSTDNGATWTQLQAVTNAALANARLGVFALGWNQTAPTTARFDYFRVVEDVPELVVTGTLSPAAPTGANGWHTGDVALTVETAGGAGTIYREYKLDGGTWAEYTTPVIVTTPGEHIVEYRASSSAGTTASQSVAFKIDKEAPVTAAELVVDEADATVRSVKIVAEDAVSGVASTEYRIGDGAWTAYSTEFAVSVDAQSIVYRATDQAGHVSAEATLDVVAAEAQLQLTPTTQVSCLAARTVVRVIVVNNDDVAANITIETPYGSKTFTDVAPGKSASVTFNTRLKTIVAGVATVTGTSTGAGEVKTFTSTVAYDGFAC